ncbi:LPS assembly lipoprotein LptE [Sandaracinobacteroides saxicola]|uniref:LPS-assembly lipoprotein n=1 Tax=Sandaracinobacteroides saxicola TaxID=2759707 RepID=A0A7G5IHM1_9SPHN|nr:LPS assembly lipoprotein LptE [Sandaracinobacteroides saxicola]QMW22863.1 hypothetical protein H3309_16465 [Sandaracinobacteroides saxicola]
MSPRLAALALLLALPGCGLTPIYSGGEAGPTATLLSQIEIAPIPDKAGFLMRDRLNQRLKPGGEVRYRLTIALDDRIDGFGVRGDNSIIRERRTLRARYQLTPVGSDKPVLDATAGSDAGIDVVGSEYATVAAETTALERLADTVADQIVARLSLYARQGQ